MTEAAASGGTAAASAAPPHSASAQPATVTLGDTQVRVDFSAPRSLARWQDFAESQPQWFGSGPARSEPLVSGAFSGRVASGASCNCSRLTLTPHGNGTHTECVGHLTRERADVGRIAPTELLPALLVTVTPSRANASGEGSEPAPQAGDSLVTRTALVAAWPARLPFKPSALVIRTGSTRTQTSTPAYLSAEAARWLVDQGILHLLLDLPSADRIDDGGRLTAHRLFFGLPPGSSALAEASRPRATITELCVVDASLDDGPWLLALQLPAIAGDALPSRPLLYPVQP